MGCIAQAIILKSAKGAVVKFVTLPATEGTGGALGSVFGKTGVSVLPVMPEGWAALGGTAPLALVLQLLPLGPPVANTPTTFFKAYGVKLPSANITKLLELSKVWEL